MAREGRVKVVRDGKTFYRRQRVGRKKSDTIIRHIDIGSKQQDIEKILNDGGWDISKSEMFDTLTDYRNTDLHYENNKIFAIVDTPISEKEGVKICRITILEVNPDMRRKGYGVKTMNNIVSKCVKENVDKIKLLSGDDNSNKFYTAIGMKIMRNDIYEGDKPWMMTFLQSI